MYKNSHINPYHWWCRYLFLIAKLPSRKGFNYIVLILWKDQLNKTYNLPLHFSCCTTWNQSHIHIQFAINIFEQLLITLYQHERTFGSVSNSFLTCLRNVLSTFLHHRFSLCLKGGTHSKHKLCTNYANSPKTYHPLSC